MAFYKTSFHLTMMFPVETPCMASLQEANCQPFDGSLYNYVN